MVLFAFQFGIHPFAKQTWLYELKINCMTFTSVVFFPHHRTNGREKRENYRFNAMSLFLRCDEVCANKVYESCEHAQGAYHRLFSLEYNDEERKENEEMNANKKGTSVCVWGSGCLFNNNEMCIKYNFEYSFWLKHWSQVLTAYNHSWYGIS